MQSKGPKIEVTIQDRILRLCSGCAEMFSLFWVFSLFLVLFMGPIVLFGVIYGFHYTIQLAFNFFFFLNFQQKIFNSK